MSDDESIEGLDEAHSSGWADYPLDSVFVRKEERSVSEVVKRIKNNRYQLNPDFQRDFVWSIEKQSKLIESCLMRIPLPVFYVAEAVDGTVIVVDGLQRLTTLLRYSENSFALRGLNTDGSSGSGNTLDGKRFKDLPLKLQERIEDTQLVFYILDSRAPERAKLDIFDRVNSGVPLSRQQMRNSLYSGTATQLLKKLAQLDLFRDATGESLDPKSMRDREALNRFCAFKLLGYETYRGDMDGFLSKSLEEMNTMSSRSLNELAKSLENSMRHNIDLFGSHCFRKSLREDAPNAKRTILNIALFDVMSVYFSDIEGSFGRRQANKVKKLVIDLLNDDDFNLAITYSTNSTNAITTRFQMFSETIDGAMQ
ncbi:hypothetical protein WYO_1819 [Methylobacterium sp. GXF4]|uniref:DUF262 domain-containing protein n=1 Tax=Methylobacterium sp. GXF4 TaxID=1096546 RepID=UPI0002697C6C|nr:DUF262 domain-containing protein [Methylobacterium sp. GXF4]EIZ85453.1 hypothetical protein WYO_1819 [Methylobacterium sp. GXF4]